MSTRELVVLGSSSQVPTRYRNHNGYLLLWDAHGLLFDPGEGTQRQLIGARVAASRITRILISHFHGDHCLGLAGLFQRISLDRVAHEVVLNYPASGQAYIDRMRRASIYQDHARIRYEPVHEAGLVARTGTLQIEAMRLDHGVETFGYRVAERDGRRMLPEALDALGVRGATIGRLQVDGTVVVDGRTIRLDEVSVPRPGQSMAFVMDTRVCPAAVALASNVDLLVCESTYLSAESRLAHDHGHLTARQAATIARDAGARRLVLTHFSQRYPDTDDFLREAGAVHDDVVVVKDFDRVGVPARVAGS